jgi:hypothetical protein
VDRQLEDADGPVRTSLQERRQLLAQDRERLPRLSATLDLFRARADAIVQQLRNIHGQVLADPGMNINEMLDEVMVRHEAITDPLQQAGADQIVSDFIRRPDVKAKLAAEKKAEAPVEPVRRPPPQRQRQ